MESLVNKITNKGNALEILKFMDNIDLLNLELVSKQFKHLIDEIYSINTNFLKSDSNLKFDSIINNANSNKENLNKYKRMFFKTYLDSFIPFNISDKKFDLLSESSESIIQEAEKPSSNKKRKDSNISKLTNPLDKMIFSNDHNKNSIKDILTRENKIFVLYKSGEIKIFSRKSQSKNFDFEFKIHIENLSITQLIFIDELESFVILDKDFKLYLMIYPKTAEFDRNIFISQIKEINFQVKSIYDLKTYVLLTDFNDKLFYFNLSDYINYNNKEKDKVIEVEKEQSLEEKKKSIDEKEKISSENLVVTYCLFHTNLAAHKLSWANSKMLILDKNYHLYLIKESDLKWNKSLTLTLKPVFEFKTKNIVDISCGEYHWLALEREDIKSIEYWDSNDLMEWFKGLGLDEFLNIIKYEKITGKDILKEDQSFFDKVLGMPDDIYQKVRYEINNVKNPYAKSIKLWGCGSHKNGQLGLFQTNNNKDNLYKFPISINLPPLQNECDYISKVFCGKTFSVILSQFGEVFITGNYENKFVPTNVKVEKTNNDGGKHKKNKTNTQSESKKDKNLPTHRWVKLTNSICFNSQSFFKIKIIKIVEKEIFFFGYKSNYVPFTLQQAKPKSKHLGIGSKKFASADKILGKVISQKLEKNYSVIYEDPLLKKLEQNLEDFLESEVPYHKIIQIKFHNEIIWDRKKRYFKYENENFD